MHCPVCSGASLIMEEWIPGLVIFKCGSCEGSWLRASDYEKWKGSSNVSFTQDTTDDYRPEYDSKKANLCPDCGRILIKYHVTKDLPFVVDHCGTCNGVWFDKKELDQLGKNDLYKYINKFFTTPWQNNLKREMTQVRMEEHYIKKFGSADYDKLKAIRDWVHSSDFKIEFISFIMDTDPYKI